MKASIQNSAVQTSPALWLLNRINDYLLLSKPRVTLLVWLTTLLGMLFAVKLTGIRADSALIFHTLLGSWLVIASANALNQVFEAPYDAKMERTASRPVPAGRVLMIEALILACVWGTLGIIQLTIFVNHLTALLGLVSILIYAFGYTPLKRSTHLCTVVGAIPGAIPPLAGWVAITGSFNAPGLLLFVLQFFWQFPHFWAIAWILRNDYSKVGFKMLPFANADGYATATCALWYSTALLPLSLVGVIFVNNRFMFITGALLLYGMILWATLKFKSSASDSSAKILLKTTLLYIPLLLFLFVICV